MRSIDNAMMEDRMEKKTIRNMWIETIKGNTSSYSGEYPLYMTLSGAEGKDIELIVESGIIGINENGSIPTEYQKTIIAIERNKQAVIRLQEKWPGLKIVEQDFKEVVAGDALITYPTGEYRTYCCSEIINLDFQDSLKIISDGGILRYPIIRWIEKISDIKLEKRPHDKWHLFMTLNADFNPDTILGNMIDVLNDNAENFEHFKQAIAGIFDTEVLNAVVNRESISELTVNKKQQLLRVFIPKMIVSILHRKGWLVKTRKNIIYGGNDSPTYMVSWMFKCELDSRAQPNAIYQDGMKSIFDDTCAIDSNGEIA